jgi:hypothetical protein
MRPKHQYGIWQSQGYSLGGGGGGGEAGAPPRPPRQAAHTTTHATPPQGRSFYLPPSAPPLRLMVGLSQRGPMKIALAHKNLHLDKPTSPLNGMHHESEVMSQSPYVKQRAPRAAAAALSPATPRPAALPPRRARLAPSLSTNNQPQPTSTNLRYNISTRSPTHSGDEYINTVVRISLHLTTSQKCMREMHARATVTTPICGHTRRRTCTLPHSTTRHRTLRTSLSFISVSAHRVRVNAPRSTRALALALSFVFARTYRSSGGTHAHTTSTKPAAPAPFALDRSR